MRRGTLIAIAAAGFAGHAEAQARGDTSQVVQRAQQLASGGNSAGARALMDSMLAVSPEGSAPYVNALYWRATMAESPDRARSDYLRIAVEFSLSPRAEDALLRLAQLELARGDRATAKKHLERLALEHDGGATRVQRLFWMGRVLLEGGSLPEGCASLAEARQQVASQDVELANQIGYYARACVAARRAADSVRADSVARVDSVVRADSLARADSAARRARTGAKAAATKSERIAPRNAPRGPVWSVQVAAYSSTEPAEKLAARMTARGYDARVTADPPYRVRIGRFTKRDDAVQLAQKLKASQTAAIVVEAEKP